VYTFFWATLYKYNIAFLTHQKPVSIHLHKTPFTRT